MSQKSIGEVLEFCYNNEDYPGDDVANAPLDVVDDTSEKATFESAATTAFSMVLENMRQQNDTAVGRFDEITSSVIVHIESFVTSLVDRLQAGLATAAQEIVTQVIRTLSSIFDQVANVFSQVVNAILGMIQRVAQSLQSLVGVMVGIVRAPVEALLNTAAGIQGRVKAFFQSIISRIVDFVTGGASDATSLTQELSRFTLAGLMATAKMSSPPAAALGVLVLVAAAIADAILVALFWIGVFLLIALAVYAIWTIIKRAMSKPRAVPKAKPRAVPRTRRRTRRKTKRKKRKKKKPLRWNASLSYGNVVSSGGMPGTLDTTAKLPVSAPLHGHHPWAQYAGGAAAQPLMSIRDMVHISTVHPILYAAMKASAIAMGQDLTTNTTNPKNIAFRIHIHNNITDRMTFAAVVTGAHAGLNAITSPAIPAAAYARGITFSFPLV